MNYFATSAKLIFCFSALLLINCASMNKQECLNADWQSIGFEDGSRGYSSTRIGSHRKACAKFNVKPDFELYQQGYAQGARQYCRPKNAYALGVRGASYSVNCPDDLLDTFILAYSEGKEIYRVKSTLKAYQKNLEHLLEAMDAIYDEKVALEQQLIAGRLSRAERKSIIRRMRELETEKDETSEKIEQHEAHIAQLQDNLHMLKANSHY